ncbi:MAG: DoxX family protein [Bacteroidota bacterium]
MSEVETAYTKLQFYTLLLLRLVIGSHFLIEGLNKLINPIWTGAPFLLQSNWIFSDMFIAIAESPTLLQISDVLNIWGQVLIGVSLIAGIFTRYASLAGAVMLLLYYVAIPPFVGGSTFVNSNLIEFFGFLVIMQFQTSHIIGLDRLIGKLKK